MHRWCSILSCRGLISIQLGCTMCSDIMAWAAWGSRACHAPSADPGPYIASAPEAAINEMLCSLSTC